MSMPGFGAEWSLGPVSGVYRGNAFLGGAGMADGGLESTRAGTTQPALGRGWRGAARLPMRTTSTIQPMLKKAQSCTTEYSGFVTYPMTVCRSPFSPPDPGAGFLTPDGGGMQGVGAPPSESTLFTKADRAHFAPTLGFCRTVYGPWLASVKQEENCDTRLPDSFALTISGGPQPVEHHWWGSLHDAPAQVGSLGNLSVSKPSCDCCPGFKECPDGSCVLNSSPCGSSTPG
jgi:hypothetical protein